MDRNQKIIKNTIAYTIGNFGSKILSYLMVLVYTHYVSSADLGYYDVIVTTVSLLQPIILLMFDDGVYRWLIDDNHKNKSVILSTCLKTVSITTAISVIILLILNLKLNFRYLLGILLFYVTSLFYQILLNSVRGLSNSRLYATSGVLNSFILLILEIFGVVVLGYGVEALLISKAIANIITIVFLFYKQKELKKLFKAPYSKELAKEIANYSLPLIPNNISWWIVNFSDRYIILFFLGVSANGIYSIANKFPTIVTTVTGILYFSFQEAMLKEYDAPDRDVFYSKLFGKYYSILFSLVACGIPLTRIVIQLFTGAEYTSAWMYSGFLYIGTVYSALATLLGIGYQISKETKRSVYSTVGAASVNVLINIAFINVIGLHAASLSTMISYIVLFAIRIRHSRKYFVLNIKWKEFFFSNFICSAVLIVTLISRSMAVSFVTTLISILCSAYLNKDMLFAILKKVKGINL